MHLCNCAVATHEARMVGVYVRMLARHQIPDHALCGRCSLVDEVLHGRHQTSLRMTTDISSADEAELRIAEHIEHTHDFAVNCAFADL